MHCACIDAQLHLHPHHMNIFIPLKLFFVIRIITSDPNGNIKGRKLFEDRSYKHHHHSSLFVLVYVLQITRSTLRSSDGPLCGSLKRRIAITAPKRNESVRKRSSASSTRSEAGASGDTSLHPHPTSHKGVIIQIYHSILRTSLCQTVCI